MAQSNARRKQALTDISALLVGLNFFQEVSGTVKSPEEASNWPAAYYTGGSGPRTPVDQQLAHYEHTPSYSIILYVHDAGDGKLADDLEDAIQKVVDAADAAIGTFMTNGYHMWASDISTDEGTLRAGGSPIAMAIITLSAKFFPEDA